MRLLLSISFLFVVNLSYCQKSAKCQTSKETYVVSYDVLSSAGQQQWNIFKTLQPEKKDSNYYICTLPLTTNYYKIKANMVSGVYYTNTVRLKTIVDAGEDKIIQLPNNINLSGTYYQTN